jgi:ketol-acid reductoisomerase
MFRLYHDQDADLSVLADSTIAVIGYGNQGRAQALNLRDSGLSVLVGNRDDDYADRARGHGFDVLPIAQAAALADVAMLLIPDELTPAVFERQIAPHLDEGDALVFASGYNVAFGFIAPPPALDVLLVAPRMIGAGVRDLYLGGRGFPSFIGVAQDHTGRAMALALALARGIGSTRAGVVEVTFAQEAELDLFTEQCFGPAFGAVLTNAVDLLLEEGYPPAAVLLELYMSGEFAYTLGKIAQMGTIEQSQLHSRTSQYGSMSRGLRFRLPQLRDRMKEGLEEIRSGAFAREWAAEQEEGCPTLEVLRQSARSLPLYRLEQELISALDDIPPAPSLGVGRRAAHAGTTAKARRRGILPRIAPAFRALLGRVPSGAADRMGLEPLREGQIEAVLRQFVELAVEDAALMAFAAGRSVTTHYVLRDAGLSFHLGFHDGVVTGGLGDPPAPAEVQLTTDADVLDAMFTGCINAAGAAMSGKISFDGDARLAMTIQRVQKDLTRLYREARGQVIS